MLFAQALSALFLISGASAARDIHFDKQVGNFSEFGGLYQSVYSEKDDVVYLTNSVGRPPVMISDLLAVDPTTLKVIQDRKPAIANATNGNYTGANITQRYAVYGVSVDDKNGFVWTTNTRQGSVSYYKENNLTLGAQYPRNVLKQARDIYVNPDNQVAYAGDATSDVIAVFNPNKTNGAQQIINLTRAIGTPFVGVMSLVADEATNTLYTVSLKNALAASIDLNTHNVSSWVLGDVERPSGVAWDSKRSRLYVANQGSNNTVVLDPKSGQVIKSINVPTGPLNARYDPLYDVVYVACRTGKAVAVIDASDYSIIANLSVPVPNHISLGANGSVFVTDKSNSSLFFKFTPHNASGNSSSGSAPGKANAASYLSTSVGVAAVGVAALFL